MDTYKKYLLSSLSNIEEIDFSKIISNNDIVKKYISMDSDLQEVEQVYQIFMFNVNAFSPYVLKPDDYVFEKDTKEIVDRYIVNALFINLISSGRILLDRIELFIKSELGDDSLKLFKNEYTSKKNDLIFAYRFFYRLRNYCQHGFLPVSRKHDGRYCFDLEQILSTNHIKLGNTLLEELSKIIEEIETKYISEPDICFTNNVDDYVKSIFEIYYRFLDYIRPDIEKTHKEISCFIEKHLDFIQKKYPYDGMILFELDDDSIHMFNSKSNLMEYYFNIRKIAKKRYRNYDSDYHLRD